MLAGCIYWMGYGEQAPIWIVLMVLNGVCSCMAAGVKHGKKTKVTVNGEELAPKEAKKC